MIVIPESGPRLSVNLNKVALLRNQRAVSYPDPIAAGRTILTAGAHGLTVHPRPDERHIRKTDVYALAAMMDDDGWRQRGIELNIEGNPFPDYLALCAATRPQQATLVPDAPDAATSETGWAVRDPETQRRLRTVIAILKDLGCRVSLFMDPDPEAMAIAAAVGADRVELYTGPYAMAAGATSGREVLERYLATARAAAAAGLGVNAGHDLTRANLPPFCAAIPFLAEVSIGHAFTADALWAGFEAAVQAYLAALTPCSRLSKAL